MHTPEKNTEEIMKGNEEGIGPLAGKVRREVWILVRG